MKSSMLKKAYILLGCLCLWGVMGHAQNKTLADSLERIYEQGGLGVQERLLVLRELASQHPNPDASEKFSLELLRSAEGPDSLDFVQDALLLLGNSARLKGNLSIALEHLFKGVDLAVEAKHNGNLGLMFTSIAGVYSVMGNSDNAIQYYKKALPILKEVNDLKNYASTLENLGDMYNLQLFKPDSALIYFEQSGKLFKALDYDLGLAYNLGNKGLAYAQKGDNIMAEANITEAITMLTRLGDYYPICVYLTYMADIYGKKNDWPSAFEYAEKSLDLARQHGLKEQISDANLKLSELYENRGDAASSLKHYKAHIAYKDSVKNIRTVQEMANLRTKNEISQKQAELDLAKQQEKNQKIIAIATAIALFLIGILAFGLYRRNRFIKRTKQIIEVERDRSDRLLRNILPDETARELKEYGKVKAKRFESVTVLFTDFEGFTNHSEQLSPEELVERVGYYFSKFDDIMEKYDLEKIKTVGDSYMCAGGLPYPTEDHAHQMLLAAIEINDFVKATKQQDTQKQVCFEVRIGINTGPLVAGVVGSKKFSYDIWGDTVNVASRMETMSIPGMINISDTTYELIKDKFECESRGEIYVKNRGMMKMYFVHGKKELGKLSKKDSNTQLDAIKT